MQEVMKILTPSISRDNVSFTMKGGIYTKEKCPLCGNPFARTEKDFLCPIHQIRPKRFYIKIYSKELHKHVPIYSNARREPFSSYEQANRILTKIRAEIDAGNFDATRYFVQKLKPLRFLNWSEDWLAKKAIEVKTGKRTPSYLKSLKAHIRRHHQPFLKEMDIRDISSKRIHEFYLSIQQAPHYVKNILDTLENMLGDAKQWGEIKEVPHFPKIEVPDPEIKTIDLDEQDKLIESIRDPMDRAYILFTAREIVRPSETRALQWSDIDLKHNRVTIRRHFSLNEIRPATKGRQIKILPLDEDVKQSLISLPRHITSPFVFWKRKQGKPFSESWARKLWKRTGRKMGIEISFYQGTRHSSATEAVDRVGLDATQEFLHHTNRRMTERYTRKNPDRLKKVLRPARERLENVNPGIEGLK